MFEPNLPTIKKLSTQNTSQTMVPIEYKPSIGLCVAFDAIFLDDSVDLPRMHLRKGKENCLQYLLLFMCYFFDKVGSIASFDHHFFMLSAA